MAAGLEEFIVAVREAVEQEARENADNRWWVLAPTLLVQHPDLGIGFSEIGPKFAGRPIGRALMAGDPRQILDALGVRRCAVVLHVDLDVDGDTFPAILVAVLSAMTASFQYARVERTDAGTPRLGPWEVGGMGEADLFAALRSAVAREPL